MPAQLLALVKQGFKISYCAKNGYHTTLRPLHDSIYQEHFQIMCSFY